MAKIKSINAREILNSAGFPCIETTVTLSDNTIGVASCPSGMSVGSYEATALLDHDDNRYFGQGVLSAIQNIQTIIAPKLINLEATKQQLIDRTMIDLDGTQNKSRLGANAILSVSMAVAKAAAASSILPLFLYLREFISIKNTPVKIPIPLFNLISGGSSNIKSLDFEEFIVTAASSKTFSESLEIGVRVRHALSEILKNTNQLTPVGPQGGFELILPTNSDAFNLLTESLRTSSLSIGYDVFLGLDANATHFYKGQQYTIKDKDVPQSSKNLNTFYEELLKQYHLLYLEDPLAEDDWDGWTDLTKRISQEALVVGDDLIATNLYRLQMAIDKHAVNAIVIKPNQVGTVIESLAVVEVARAANLKVVLSTRSEETNDDFIADFAVAASADYIKFGPAVHGEHVQKYNRLLQIEQQLKLL